MKKILMILLIIFMFSTYDVFAKEIIIDGVKYDDSKDINGDGFYFNTNNKTLYLDGYNGGVIVYDSILQLRIENNNVINGNENNAINCREVSIYGNGVLNIYNSDVGINCERLQVQLSKIYITKCNTGINAYGMEIYLDMMNLIVEDCINAINSPDNIYIGSTKVNVIDCNYGVNGKWLKTLALNNSVLYVKTEDYCLYNIQIVDSTRSKIVLESDIGVLNSNNINENESNAIYVSNDKENYFVDSSYFFYPYLKLANKNQINDLLISDEGLIIEVDKSFLEVNDEDKNNQTDDSNEEVDDKENENIDNEKDNEDDNANENIGNEKDDADENIDNEKDDEDDNELEIITKNEYTEDEFLDIDIINPSTIDNIFVFIIMFFVSFFICIITFYIRRNNG